MTDQDRPTRHPAVETALFGAEAVLYDERSGTVHHLNPPACAIWVLLDGRPLGDVIATLAEMTGVPPNELRGDVLGTIAELRSAGLVSS